MPWAELTDSRCWYELTGSGEPLVLIPGLGALYTVYDPAVEALAERFSVIRMDNRGIGMSEARRPAARLHDYAADVAELLDHLQIERAHVLGLSLGGMIAQRFAMDHKPRVDRLVLVSTAHRFGPYLRETALMIGQALRRFPRRQYVRLLELLSTGPGFLDADPNRMEDRIQETMARDVPRHAIVHQLRALSKSDPLADEFVIDAPTLVLAGEYDALIPAYYGRAMAEAIGAHARFRLIEHAGHNPFVECPQTVLPLIVSFLSERRADPAPEPERHAA